MGEYLFKCLERLDKVFDGKILLTVLKEVTSKTIKIRGDLDANRVPESRIKRIISNSFGETKCDYVLLLDNEGKAEILMPVSDVATTVRTVIFPRIARLKGIQLLKKQEKVELEANAVFSRSLINENIDVDDSYYVFEGRVGLVEPHDDAVAVRILTDKGTRVILNGEHIEKIKKESIKPLKPQALRQRVAVKKVTKKQRKAKKRTKREKVLRKRKPKRKSRTQRKKRTSKKKR